MRQITCRSCGTQVKMSGPAPPGAIPVGWAILSGAARCPDCLAGAPLMDTGTRIAEVATLAVIEMLSADPVTRQHLVASLWDSPTGGGSSNSAPRGGGYENARLVRAAAEGLSAIEKLPKPLGALLREVLACVNWVRVAQHFARRAGPERSVPPEPPDGDPFSL